MIFALLATLVIPHSDLWAAVGPSLTLFSPTECRNYSRHCGYAAAMSS